MTFAALVMFGWQKLQRPLPIEERMPLAGDDNVASPNASGSSGRGLEGGGSAGSSAEGDRGSAADGASSTSGAAGSGGAQDSGEHASGSGKIIVHVAGAVLSPGVVTLGADSRVVDAITAAGGLRPDADPDRVNLAEPLSDGVRIVVPAVGEDAIPEAVQLKMPQPSGSAGGGSSSSPAALVNVNTATATDLEQLPGVGPATSAAIIAKREKDGPFRSVDSLLDVKGIGEAKLEGLRDLVTVG